MVYRESFVAVIKCKGKILREHDNVVTLPFGSEYSILLKNLEARRASVKISIDGKDVLKEGTFVVDPNSEVEIERFVEELDKGNRFKFIHKTEQISKYRGDRIDDGIIRIEFCFEEKSPAFFDIGYNMSNPYYRSGGTGDNSLLWRSDYYCGDSNIRSFSAQNCSSGPVFSASVDSFSSPNQDEGITVPGSISEQKFQRVKLGTLESTKHVITLKLRGVTEEKKKISIPITVKTKLKCPTCGKKSNSRNKFCGRCGTSLI